MPLGIYISVPFCRTKCSFCNFASDVVSKAAYARYVDRVAADVAGAQAFAQSIGARFDRTVDSIYLGGGTPTVLDPAQLVRLLSTIRHNFQVEPTAEVTVECAPGTLSDDMLAALRECGVNRVSLGVQSFVDEEARSVGRLHTRDIVLKDIARLRTMGIANLSIDLIAGLPHQTRQSWEYSLAETIAAKVPHVSVYMLEVDEDSRLGRELIAGGTRYHAHFVPDDDLTADLYTYACERLNEAGIAQYEISNFARPGCESRHNLKYWTRAPYLGFGVDAHSMLPAAPERPEVESLRFATPDALEAFMAAKPPTVTEVNAAASREEQYFLGLRLNQGVDAAGTRFREAITDLAALGLVQVDDDRVRLTPRGRLLSNEVFLRLLNDTSATKVESGGRGRSVNSNVR